MPVDVLLCEGIGGSPDIHILGKIVTTLKIEPAGSKSTILRRVDEKRIDKNNQNVYCILDRDFDKEWDGIKDTPSKVLMKQSGDGGEVHYGWKWARKEIENYLIDPEILKSLIAKRIRYTCLYC